MDVQTEGHDLFLPYWYKCKMSTSVDSIVYKFVMGKISKQLDHNVMQRVSLYEHFR